MYEARSGRMDNRNDITLHLRDAEETAYKTSGKIAHSTLTQSEGRTRIGVSERDG